MERKVWVKEKLTWVVKKVLVEENSIFVPFVGGRSNLKLSVIIEFIKNDQRIMEKKWEKKLYVNRVCRDYHSIQWDSQFEIREKLDEEKGLNFIYVHRERGRLWKKNPPFNLLKYTLSNILKFHLSSHSIMEWGRK